MIGVCVAYVVTLYLWGRQSEISLSQWARALLFLAVLFGPVIIGCLVLALLLPQTE